MNYVILNGINSNTIQGLLIQSLPPISKPLMRTQREEIDGRDGDIVTKLGYSAYDKEMSIGLYGDYDVNEVIAFFASEGVVTFSNEPDKYYYYKVLEQIDFERLIRFKTATVTFHCQPFKYKVDEAAISIGSEDYEGDIVELDNGGYISELVADINPIQDLNGQTSPYPAGGGKNLIGFSDATGVASGTHKALTTSNGLIRLVADGTVLASSMITPQAMAQVMLGGVLQAGTYIFSVSSLTSSFTGITAGAIKLVLSDGTTVASGSSFTITSEKTVDSIVYSSNVAYSSGSYIQFYVQIESGSTATDYAPYSNICPISGHTEVNVIRTGKNLFDKSMTLGNGNITDTGSIGTAGSYEHTDYISVKELTSYITSGDVAASGGRNAIAYYDSSKTFISRYLPSVAGGTTFTTPANCSYIRMNLYKANVDTIQLELGSTATTYEPYAGQTYPISLGQTVYDGTLNVTTGVLTIDRGFATFDGSSDESWTVGSANAAIDISDMPSGSNMSGLSNMYVVGSSAGQLRLGNNNKKLYLVSIVSTQGITTLAQLQTFLSGNPLQVVYPLATPTTVQLTPQQIATLIGEKNYIWADSGDIALTNTDGSVVVTNEGNTTARPKITLTGNGNISLRLNETEVLSIALGDEEFITIDSAQMEAYKNGVLKNRLVSGNYNKLVLNSGENEVSWAGGVTDAVIENYTRWI